MKLHAHEKAFGRDFHRFHQTAVGRSAGYFHAVCLEQVAEAVVELIAVAVAFAYGVRAVAFNHEAVRRQPARIRPQAHGAALWQVAFLVRHEVDDFVVALGVELGGVSVLKAQHVARELDDGGLHAQANAEIRQVVFTGVFRRDDFAFDTPVAEPARHYYAGGAAQQSGGGFFRYFFRLDPPYFNFGVVGIAAVPQRLGNGHIRVVHPDVFAHQGDFHFFMRLLYFETHVRPVAEVGLFGPLTQFATDDARHVVFFKHKRRLVNVFYGEAFYHAIWLDVAKQGEFLLGGVVQRHVAAGHHDVGRNAHAAQFFHRVLRRLCLLLAAAGDVRHQRDVDKQAVAAPGVAADLTYCLDKRLRLDVAYGAAYFRHYDVGVGLFADGIDKFLDFVGDVRNNLHRFAQIFALTLFVEHVPIYFARRQVGIFVEVFVDKPFVMPQVEVGFGAVFGDVHLAVLIRAHCAGVYVDVRVEFLCGDFKPALFEKPAQRRHDYALAQSRHNAARHEDIFDLL